MLKIERKRNSETRQWLLNEQGFTLAELLIVVAIIGVLVAISIPIFTSQLEKAREATDASNIRSKYAEMLVEVITGDRTESSLSLENSEYKVQGVQKQNGWQTEVLKTALPLVQDNEPIADGICTIYYADGQAHCTWSEGSSSGGTPSGGSGSGSDVNPGGSSGAGGAGSGTVTPGGSTSGGSGLISNPDDINTSTKLPNAFNSSIRDWNITVRENPSYNIVPGMVYSYKGSMYFGTSKALVKNDQYTHQTPEEVVGWNAMAKYTGKIWSESDFTSTRNDVNRGDLCKIGNDYYVYKVGNNGSLNTTGGPLTTGGSWQKISLES